MHFISQITIYIIGTFLSIKDLTNLALTSKDMSKQTEEARKLIAKREVIRLFSSNLEEFR
jgi:hypothetical protein